MEDPGCGRDGCVIDAKISMHDLLRFTDIHCTRAAVRVGVGLRGSCRSFWYVMGTEGVFGFRVPWPVGGGGRGGWRTGEVCVEDYGVCEGGDDEAERWMWIWGETKSALEWGIRAGMSGLFFLCVF